MTSGRGAEARGHGAQARGRGPLSQPHRRHNPLTDEWVLVSADRIGRPWLGGRETATRSPLIPYDPECYLCPGNLRANGTRNPEYLQTHVFTNDFAALHPDSPVVRLDEGLLRAEGEAGTCRVICFAPRHDLTLGSMSVGQVRSVVDVWASESVELGRRFPWVQVFENRGEAMGTSNPHPHGQIWAGTALTTEAVKELLAQRRHFEATGHRLLLDYVDQEVGSSRVVAVDDEWLVVVPFWAAWPFETLIVPRRAAARLPDLDERQRDHLAARLIGLLQHFDALFGRPFPYSMGWHQAPFDAEDHPSWQLHGHFYPPLLRATVRKFMVGYELLSEPQRDITPEDAAQRLRRAGEPGDRVGHPDDRAVVTPGDGQA